MILADIPVVLAYRALPFCVYAIFARKISWQQRISIWGMFLCALGVGSLASRDLSEVLVRGPVALAYFAVLSLGVHRLAAKGDIRPAAKLVLFVGCAVAYVLVPAIVYPSPRALPTIGIGFEAALSAYSYGVDAQRRPSPPTRGDCLFFILVNPCLVYPERGRMFEDGSGSVRGAARVVLGAATWIAQLFVTATLATSPSITNLYGRFWLLTGGAAIALYFAHSGLASIQIGLMRMAGHVVGERYNKPFLARNPLDFWKRWNRYLGSWIKRYVFVPSAFRIHRALPRLPARATAALAVILTFAVVGALHEYVLWSWQLVTTGAAAPALRVTFAFLGFGVILLVWRGAADLLSHALGVQPSQAAFTRRSRVFLSQVAFLHVALAMMWMLQQARFIP